MKVGLLAAAALIAMTSTEASAQVINLSGPYRCVQGCTEGLIGQPAFITQYGWDMNLLNEAGMPARAWIDWPGHIWVDFWHEGAVWPVDGLTINSIAGPSGNASRCTDACRASSFRGAGSSVVPGPQSARARRNAELLGSFRRPPPGSIPSTAVGVVIQAQTGCGSDIATAYRSATAISPRTLANPLA